MPLLEGLDGVKKMSKSLGNYIGIRDEPNDIYGKVMSIPDELMMKYYELATDISGEELERLKDGLKKNSIHPRNAKMNLAFTFVRMYYGEKTAKEAEQYFRTVFQRQQIPDEMDEVEIATEELAGDELWIVTLLSKLGLVANQEKVSDVGLHVPVKDGMVVQVGRRKFARVKVM
jgi:tyrosyl-tRNA synthetase